MTIEECKHILVRIEMKIKDPSERKALFMAMASLEAWDEVKQEINDLFNKPAFYMPNYDAYKMFLDIIDKHLQEVTG